MSLSRSVLFFSRYSTKHPGVNPQELNTRTVMGFRETGRGRDAMLTFPVIMIIPSSGTKSNYGNYCK